MSQFGHDRYGYDQYGDGYSEGVDLDIIIGASPDIIPTDGGVTIAFEGNFNPNSAYYVYVGATGTIEDAPAYSGVPNRGYRLVPISPTILEGISPVLPVGNPLVTVVSGGVVYAYSNILTVVPRVWAGKQFYMRKKFQPIYAVGHRRLIDEDPI